MGFIRFSTLILQCSLFATRLLSQVFLIDYSEVINPHYLLAYDFSILSPYAKVDLTPGHKLGNKFFAYISVGEIAPDAPYRERALSKTIPLFGKNEVWKSDLVDLSSPAWIDFVLELATNAVQKDFDGFFLDTVDSVELLMQKNPARSESYRQGVIQLVEKLKANFPTKRIILNRGFRVIEDVQKNVDGLLLESLFQTFDPAKKSYMPVAPAATQELIGRLKAVQALGLPIYVVDYVDPKESELALRTAQRIEKLGFHPLITTSDLTGKILAPLTPKPRYLLNCFGNQSKELENLIKWPADAFAASATQVVLEWLGYELDYLNLVTSMPPEVLDQKYCGIILDRFLEIPSDKEESFLNWLLNQKSRGMKLIILGDIPFEDEAHRTRLLKALGIGGSGQLIEQPLGLEIRTMAEPFMNFETKLRLLPSNFRDFRAPLGSHVYLSLQGQNRQGRTYTCDSIFVSNWGGVALDPFLTFQRPDFFELWLLDPFRFFGAALQTDQGPVPDSTTRDGLRLFYSHIDGDGFGNLSIVETGKRSAEIIRDRIIKVFPVPITCSVIEAEIRGRVMGQKPEDEKQLTEIARSIFALPNVQAGSHSYTHPFYWMSDDRTALAHEGQNLVLAEDFRKENLDFRREIVGSVNYIEENLLPTGKKISVFLWSGNCRPGPEALRLTKELGIEDMNGGETLISEKYPSISAVAPRVMCWENELQVYAANQNENEFNNNWQGPLYGGYIHTIETFKRTEAPRRLKPINIYYHMYSGDYYDSLNVLSQAYDFALTQKIHAVTAAQFAEIIRDSRRTSVFQKSQDHWVLVNDGNLRTFRLPRTGKVPDLSKSKGVTGFNLGTDVLYVHTDGSPKVEIVLSTGGRRHPFLRSSSTEIKFEKLTMKEISFKAVDYRPITVEMEGFAPDSALKVQVNHASKTITSDALGRITLLLPLRAEVAISIPSLN
jgi:hypothetical protein